MCVELIATSISWHQLQGEEVVNSGVKVNPEMMEQ